MIGVSFSSTEKWILATVADLKTPLPLESSDYPLRLKTEVWNALRSEVLSRAVSIFTSVFAAADAITHLSVAGYKGGYLTLKNVFHLPDPTWDSAEVYSHFQRAASFAGLAFYGSTVGLIWPSALLHSRLPSDPPEPPSSDSRPRPPSGPTGQSTPPISYLDNPHAPEALKLLAQKVRSGQECAPFPQLKQFWDRSRLLDKHWFVQIFGSDGSNHFAPVRISLADTVYRPIARSFQTRHIQWLSEKEVDQKIHRVWDRQNPFNRAAFFHATSEKALESILKSRKVEVRHEKLFRGAFVSTRPELGFGNCVLAFKRNIERLSTLGHGFTMGQTTYWAGFSEGIPVDDTTLAYIILEKGTDSECKELQDRCKQWTGRSIDVISLKDVADRLDSVNRLDMGIPIEWPEEGEHVGQGILKTLRVAVAVKVAQPQYVHAYAGHA